MSGMTVPDGLIWVMAAATMRGVKYGDVVLVDPTNPEIAALLDGHLLVPTDPPPPPPPEET